MVTFKNRNFESKAEAVRWYASTGVLSITDVQRKKIVANELGMTVQTVHATLKAYINGRKSLQRTPIANVNLPRTDRILQQKVTDKAQECIDLYNRKFRQDLKMPNQKWDLRGAVAGKWNPRTHTLHWHPVLAAQNEEHYIAQTVPHEVAHFITRAMFGPFPKSHGYEWKTTMHQLGVQAICYHNYDVVQVKKSRSPYKYKCSCMEHMVGGIRHTKLQRGIRYTCNRCKGTLTFVEKVS
jgi:SprT protein